MTCVISELTVNAILAEAMRAHLKHGKNSMLADGQNLDRKLSIATEELGEVARVLNDAVIEGALDHDKLEMELIQAAAMFASLVEYVATSTPEDLLARLMPQ